MMSESLNLLLALGTGGLLGALFFGGLWWTVRTSLCSKQPALWFFGSFLLRTGIALVGLYFIGREHWERLIVCLVGFVAARLIVTWLTRSAPANSELPRPEARHAP
jgi:F1F0 ATPase subunit 2